MTRGQDGRLWVGRVSSLCDAVRGLSFGAHGVTRPAIAIVNTGFNSIFFLDRPSATLEREPAWPEQTRGAAPLSLFSARGSDLQIRSRFEQTCSTGIGPLAREDARLECIVTAAIPVMCILREVKRSR